MYKIMKYTTDEFSTPRMEPVGHPYDELEEARKELNTIVNALTDSPGVLHQHFDGKDIALYEEDRTGPSDDDEINWVGVCLMIVPA